MLSVMGNIEEEQLIIVFFFLRNNGCSVEQYSFSLLQNNAISV